MPGSNLEAEWPGTSSTCLQFPVHPKAWLTIFPTSHYDCLLSPGHALCILSSFLYSWSHLFIQSLLLLKCTAQAHILPSSLLELFILHRLSCLELLWHPFHVCDMQLCLCGSSSLSVSWQSGCPVMETYTSVDLLYYQRNSWDASNKCPENVTPLIVIPHNKFPNLFDKPTSLLMFCMCVSSHSQHRDRIDACLLVTH